MQDFSSLTHEDHLFYLSQAYAMTHYSGCIRRKYGAVIVGNDGLITSHGTNSSPVGTVPCTNLGQCLREKLNIPRGTQYEKCRSVHAEANAIIRSDPKKLVKSVLYLAGVESDGSPVQNLEPCYMCKRLIINSGISHVVVRLSNSTYNVIDVESEWVHNDTTLKEDTYIKR